MADPRSAMQRAGISSFTKGALSNIVIRGYQRENIFIVFDGAPYFGATPFRVDAPPFLIQNLDVRKIVVTKGPYNLALPGALGGSVEVETPDTPRRFGGKASVSYGSYDAVDGRAFLSVGNQQADLGGGYLGRYSGVPTAGDGVPFTSTVYPTFNANYRQGSEQLPMYRIDSFWLKAGVNPSNTSRCELSYAFLQGTDIKVPTLNFDLSDEQVHRLNGQVTVQAISPVVQKIRLQGWWSKARTLLDDSLRIFSDPYNAVQQAGQTAAYRNALLVGNRSYAMSNRFEVSTYGARLTADLALGPGKLRNGVDFYQRSWSGSYSSLLNAGGWSYFDNQTLLPDVTTRNVGLFAIYETSLTKTLRTVISTRGDISRISADGLTPGLVTGFYQPYYPGQAIPTGRDFANWSANAQLFWQALPELELFLKGGRATRIPDAHELFVRQVRQGSNLLGNPFLKNTVLHQVDSGAIWTSQAGDRAELTFFYGQADNFVLPVQRVVTGQPQARSTTNLNATIWGVEFDGVLQLPAQLKLTGMLAYSEGRNLTNNRPLAEVPPLRGRLALQYDDRTFFGSVSQSLVARQNRFDSSLNETSMPGYGVTDLTLGARYSGFVVTATINNLCDIRYVQPLSYQRDPLGMAVRIPENGRNFTLSASYRF